LPADQGAAVIQDLDLRWVVTVLFGLSAAAWVYVIARGPRRGTHLVGQALHTVMAVAMVVMAWPPGAKLPSTAGMVFFLLAAVWFAVIAVSHAGAGHRLIDGYHALMMLAMAWMYALMNDQLLARRSAGQHTTPMPNMPGMQMPGMDMPMDSADAHASTVDTGYPAWITAINWALAIGFAAAAVFWIYRCFARGSAGDADQRWSVVAQAMMAAGMAIAFAVLL